MKKPSKAKEQPKRLDQVKKQRNWPQFLSQYRYGIVFLLAFALYGNTIFNDYNMDDELVTRNHVLSSQGVNIDNIQKIFTQPYYQDNMGYSYGYRPLTILSFAIEHSIFGDNPHASHFINILLFGLLCVVLLKMLELMLVRYDKWFPLVAISIFICHPIHTEVIASIKNRDEIMSFLCGGIAIIAFFIHRPFWQRFVFSLTAFAAGMLFKPNLLLLPSLIVLALLFFKKEKPFFVFLISGIFAFTCICFIENVTDSLKALYICLNIIFCLFMIVYFAEWRSLEYYKSIIFTSEESADQPEKKFTPVLLKDKAYFVFLALNILIGVIAFYLSAKYSTPWFTICVAFIFLAELYFFKLSQLWVIIILIDVASLLLLFSNPNLHRISILVKTNFFSIFIFFHAALILNLKSYKFWLGFAVSYIAVAIYVFLHPYPGAPYNFLVVLVLYPTIVYIYYSRLYISRKMTIALFVLVCMVGLEIINSVHDFGYRPLLITDIAEFVFLVLVFCVSYFKVPFSKIPIGLAIVQVLFISYIYAFSPEFKNSTAQELTKIQPTLPQAYNNQKTNRPLNFIEIPVDYKSPEDIRIGTSAYQFGKYILLIVKPWPMSYYYGYKVIVAHQLSEPIVILCLILFAGLILCAFWMARKNFISSFGLFFMMFSILPYLNVVTVIPGMIADRYTFQASFGFCILLASGFFYLYDLRVGKVLSSYTNTSKSRNIVRFSFGGLILIYSIITLIRGSEWKDTITLMRHDIKTVPESVQAQNLLAINLVKESFAVTAGSEQRQMREEALEHLKTAYTLYPGYFNFPYDIGRIFLLLNNTDSALAYFKVAYALNKDFPDLTMSLADIYYNKKDFQSAIPFFSALVHDNPDNYSLYDKLSYAYFMLGEPKKSIKTNMDAIKRAPSRSEPYVNIGICYFNTNQTDSSKIWFKKALTVNPNDALAQNYLQKLK